MKSPRRGSFKKFFFPRQGFVFKKFFLRKFFKYFVFRNPDGGGGSSPRRGGGHSMNNFRLYSYSGNIPKITEEERSRLNPLRGGGDPSPALKIQMLHLFLFL